MKLKSFLFSLILLLTACKDEPILSYNETATPLETEQRDYSIPMDSALANLTRFMETFEATTSRAGNTRKVSNIDAIKYPKNNSRATSTNCENILYI